MYIKELTLENFKRFSDVQIDLSKNITLLLGPNSSGKSSVLKALLGLKQTASPSNEHEVFSAQGEYVDLGVYKDFVLEHDVSKKIKIGFSISPDEFRNHQIFENIEKFEFCFAHDFATEQARLHELLIYSSSADGTPTLRLSKKQTRDSFLLAFSEASAENAIQSIYNDERTAGSERIRKAWVNGLTAIAGDRYQFSAQRSASRKRDNSDFLLNYPVSSFSSVIASLLRKLDRDFYYLGPLRRSPSRSYNRTAHLLSVGPSGEHTPSVLANLKSRASKERSRDREQGRRRDQLASWVESIFPGRTIDSKTVEELVKLEIGRQGGAKEVISDVGFGFSQVLPILVQAAVMPANTTLLIEQPELHLHPSAQTKLAGVIADASNSGRRFIIETHSEHFVRGLQVAISNGTVKRSSSTQRLKPADLKCIYIPKAPEEPRTLPLDEWGEFTEPWPTGFFDEGYLSTLRLLENKMAAQAKDQTSQQRAISNSISPKGDKR